MLFLRALLWLLRFSRRFVKIKSCLHLLLVGFAYSLDVLTFGTHWISELFQLWVRILNWLSVTMRTIILLKWRKNVFCWGHVRDWKLWVQVPSIWGEIPEYSRVLIDFFGCKKIFLKKVWVQLHPLHPHLRDPWLSIKENRFVSFSSWSPDFTQTEQLLSI